MLHATQRPVSCNCRWWSERDRSKLGFVRAQILVVDDHRVFAEALACRLELEPDFSVTAIADSVVEAETLARRQHFDVALVDVDLAGDDGISLGSRLQHSQPRLQIVVVSCHDDSKTAASAFRHGAAGFVAKGADATWLTKSIRGVLRGETWVAPALLTGVLDEFLERTSSARPGGEKGLAGLTAREGEVLECMAQGMDRAATARQLSLSTNTVRTHAQNLLAKLDAHSSVEAVAVALQAGWRRAGSQDRETR